MERYVEMTSAEFTDVLSEKLAGYRPSTALLSSNMFYFDGQDPFTFSEPSLAIHSLHASLDPSAKRRFEDALINVIGSRNYYFSDEVVKQLAMAVGNLRKVRLVLPMVNNIKARAARSDAPRELFVIAIMVLKGFGSQTEVMKATRELMGLKDFPRDLILDGLEILVAGHSDSWDKDFREWRPRLEADYASDHARLRSRLEDTAACYVKHLSIQTLKRGIDMLIAFDEEALAWRSLEDRTDVTAAFIWALRTADARLRRDKPLKAPTAIANDSHLKFMEAWE